MVYILCLSVSWIKRQVLKEQAGVWQYIQAGLYGAGRGWTVNTELIKGHARTHTHTSTHTSVWECGVIIKKVNFEVQLWLNVNKSSLSTEHVSHFILICLRFLTFSPSRLCLHANATARRRCATATLRCSLHRSWKSTEQIYYLINGWWGKMFHFKSLNVHLIIQVRHIIKHSLIYYVSPAEL